MRLKIIFIGALLTLVNVGAFSQKVKYKDLFLLLNAHQYKDAEPFLKKFLKDNPEHPNGLLNMGMIFQDKSGKNDVLKETDKLGSNADSAVIFFEKASRFMTEKEIKKNDEYYESYKRRDLRTGDFAVKLSDVQFDIQKRIESLKERKARSLELREHFNASETQYGRARQLYLQIQSLFPGEKELFLRADEKTVASLEQLVLVYDSSQATFKSYKATSLLLGKTGYNQVMNPQEIKNFKKEGASAVNFAQDDLQVWDFKSWALRIQQVVEKQMIPLRQKLASYDMEINKVREKLKRDSVDIRSELPQLIVKSPVAELDKVDPGALPGAIFDMKMAELGYANELVLHRPFRDSLDVNLKLRNVRNELEKVAVLDSVTNLLQNRDIDVESENYQQFVNSAYGTVDVLKNLIKSTHDFAVREKGKKLQEFEVKSRSLNWMVIAHDSIPVTPEAGQSSVRFRPMQLVPEDHTFGLQFADSVATGYFLTITPSRLADLKASIPLDAKVYTRRTAPLVKGLSCRDERKLVYFVLYYSEAKVKEKYAVTISKIYRSDGLAWTHTYAFDALPVSLSYDATTSELGVKVVNAAGENGLTSIDKSGKQLK